MKTKKYITTFRISLKNTLFYKKNLVGGIIMNALFIYVFFLLWKVIYQGDRIAGYTFRQMIWYVCITELMAMSMGGGAFFSIGQDVKSGAIAYQLGRPYQYIWYQFSTIMGGALFRLALFSIFIAAWGTLLVGAPAGVPLVAVPLFLAALILSFILKFFMMIVIGLTAFFVEENRPFFFIYSKLILILGTFLPIEFFPGWMRSVLRYMPFSLVSWGPAKMFVDFSWEHAAFAIPALAVWAGVFIAIAFAVYSKGVRKVHVHGG